MNIGIEARWITFERTGFGNYAFNLLSELGKIDSKNNYLVYLNGDYLNEHIFLRPNFEKKVLPRRPEFYKHISIPWDIIINRRKLDLFHFLYNAPSLVTPVPFILTVHDVSYRHIPNMISKKDLASISVQLSIKARKARKVITVSENSKKDIIKYFRVPAERIEVIYEGVANSFRRISDEAVKNDVSAKYGLPSKFLLYVGTYLPHKNLETLLRAYRELRNDLRIPQSLVLAGKKGRNYDTISRLISEFGLEDDVKLTGFVKDDDLPSVYSLSDAFIFPSLYEGFGLPILEAMACGTPVIAANTSCLPEIGGDAAVYFSAMDFQELARKIRDVLANGSLSRELSERGFKRAAAFSWARMAAKTLEVYESVRA